MSNPAPTVKPGWPALLVVGWTQSIGGPEVILTQILRETPPVEAPAGMTHYQLVLDTKPGTIFTSPSFKPFKVNERLVVSTRGTANANATNYCKVTKVVGPGTYIVEGPLQLNN